MPKFAGRLAQSKQVTVIFPPDVVVAHLTYRSTPSRLRLVMRKNSSSRDDFNFTTHPGGIVQQLRWAVGGTNALAVKSQARKKIICRHEKEEIFLCHG